GARLEQMAKPMGACVLISQATWERVRDMDGVEFVPRGERDVKGRQEKIAVYEVRAKEVGNASPQVVDGGVSAADAGGGVVRR
ncbi:MAG: hypothetical protein ACYCW6_30825, partial [Candidatus Xenobia bacterium]